MIMMYDSRYIYDVLYYKLYVKFLFLICAYKIKSDTSEFI